MKANYFKVGLFVLVAGAVLVAAIVVLGAGYIGRTVVHFETYFDESVSGLTVGSIVEVRGVRMGEVKEIGFLRDTYDLPTRAIPTHAGSFASSSSRTRRASRTSLRPSTRPDGSGAWNAACACGSLRTSSPARRFSKARTSIRTASRRSKPTWQPRYTYIPAIQSELSTIKDSVDRVLTKLEQLDVNGLVSTTKSADGLAEQDGQ